MKSIVLNGTLRTENGKKAAKNLRNTGEVLCNLYGGADNVMFSAPYNSFTPIVYSPDFYKIEIKLEDKSYTALVKDIQFHPVSDKIQHIDFLELVPGKIIIAEIPIVLVGQADGVKAGGKLIQKLRKLKVKSTPENLVDKIEVNVASLKLGKSIKVRNINQPTLEIMNPAPVPVASVEVPRALRGSFKASADEEEEPVAEVAAESAE
jgi:large subunit ribosomal protein L25